ncbi:MAG: 1-acyl-sn-glycerol-3-phosphate acyltransferase [Flavobacteriales bacterium]|nr:1-acyl-sn-glycerol-3-phosphate acyltransferase [Flavobacteriales bacterium]
MSLQRLANFIALASIKLFAITFYKVENTWLHNHEEDPWKGMRLLVLLNHTSLFEPLLLGAAPWRMLWRIAGRIIAPGADVTMDRPIAGKFLKYIAPKMVPISRERDETWDNFLNAIEPESVVIIAPEGRMKRADGLDKHGNPMSVRGGVADILEMLQTGKMVIVYSGGLHHVQVPGQGLPKLFKHIRLQSEKVDIADYIEQMRQMPDVSFRKAVVQDMEDRMELNVPK